MREIAWIAGFLEGEGSFYFNQRNRTFKVQAVQNDRQLLDKLQTLYGGSVHKHSFSKSGEPYWSWHLSQSRAVGLAMTIYTLMSDHRKEQIRKALDEWKKLPTTKQSVTKAWKFNNKERFQQG